SLLNGISRTNIARLNSDGSLDPGFQNGLDGTDDDVLSVAPLADGTVLISGAFRYVNGSPRPSIARLSADGNLDAGFLNWPDGADGEVSSVAAQDDGSVIIGGWFTTVAGQPRHRIARLNPDGSLDASFQNGLSGADDWINSVVVQPDGQVLVGGG